MREGQEEMRGRRESCCCESFGKIASLSFPSDTFSLSKESNQALVMFIPWRLEHSEYSYDQKDQRRGKRSASAIAFLLFFSRPHLAIPLQREEAIFSCLS